MQVSYRWLKNYVDIPWEPQALGDRLTLSGVAVDEVISRGQSPTGVFTGRITELTAHPNANKLQICRLSMGAERGELTIVTGATNVFVGAVVPVAVAGADLPIGKSILESDFRGVLSQGMLCSGDELGLEKKVVPPQMRDGIYLLPADTLLGQDIREVMAFHDHLLELDLTPNRSDCLSVLGLAYEVAALAGGKVRLPVCKQLETQAVADTIKVTIADRGLCPGYLGLVVDAVKIGPSPLWLQNALQAAGLRPINNIVDITNYVLLELGQPLHAFDLDLLQGQEIVVRRAGMAEQMVTLDGVSRELDDDMLVIADRDRAVAVAGVMGGAETEVTVNTQSVFLESAWFLPQSIRRTSRRLGLRTDASSRFDKGVDPARVIMALGRAAEMIEQIGAGQPRASMVGNLDEVAFSQQISLRPARVNGLLGTDIAEAEMHQILARLGLDVDDNKLPWLVTAPSRRPDLTTEVDLIEEIARLHGYDRIPTSTMFGKVLEGKLNPRQRMLSALRQGALGLGANEAVTLSFINPKAVTSLVGTDHPWSKLLALQNPLSSERSVMRPSLLFGLLDVLAYNGARQQSDFAIFELASVFLPISSETLSQPSEPMHFALAAIGQQVNGWQSAPTEYDFYQVKGMVERLLLPYGISGLLWQPTADWVFLHPGRAASVTWNGQLLGFVGELHPAALDQYGLRKRAIVAELNLEPLLAQAGFVPLFGGMPKFPTAERDLAVTVAQDVSAASVAACIRKAAGGLLADLRLFDVYQGGQVMEGKKSLAYSLVLQSAERTLQEEEIAELHAHILECLAKELGALLR